MAVELLDLVPTLERTVNPPGGDLFPNTHASEWIGRLQDAFWAGRLAGFFSGYTEVEGVIRPQTDGDEDLGREVQEVIIQFAALRALRAKLLQLPTKTKYVAPGVESEVQRSAQVLVQLLKDSAAELERLRVQLSRQTSYGSVAFLDGMVINTNRFLDDTGYGWVN